MSMSRPQPINVFLVATASAALHGGAAALLAPILSFLLLCWSTPAAQIERAAKSEDAMVLAVLSPAVSAIFGFCAGALAGLGHNVFARNQRSIAIRLSEGRKVRAASFSNVAQLPRGAARVLRRRGRAAVYLGSALACNRPLVAAGPGFAERTVFCGMLNPAGTLLFPS